MPDNIIDEITGKYGIIIIPENANFTDRFISNYEKMKNNPLIQLTENQVKIYYADNGKKKLIIYNVNDIICIILKKHYFTSSITINTVKSGFEILFSTKFFDKFNDLKNLIETQENNIKNITNADNNENKLIQILKERLAKGEINIEEFENLKKEIK